MGSTVHVRNSWSFWDTRATAPATCSPSIAGESAVAPDFAPDFSEDELGNVLEPLGSTATCCMNSSPMPCRKEAVNK